jgi:hypothetical protein
MRQNAYFDAREKRHFPVKNAKKSAQNLSIFNQFLNGF